MNKEYTYKGATKTTKTEYSADGEVVSYNEEITANWEEMNINNNTQQQQQQSSREDGPGIA